MKGSIDRAARVPEAHGMTAERFAAEVAPAYRPVILRRLVAHWPATVAARGSTGRRRHGADLPA